jgi:hypothetical protein
MRRSSSRGRAAAAWARSTAWLACCSREAAADTARYSSVDYGVPLNDDELKELARRAKIQEDMDPFVEKLAENDTYAGVYLDQQSHGAPVFMFTADIPERTDELSRGLSLSPRPNSATLHPSRILSPEGSR